MAKIFFLLTIVLIFFIVNLASAVDFNKLLSQVTSELINKGVATTDVNTIKPSLSNLLGLGINKESLIKIVTDLVGLGVSGDILNNPLQALTGLVQNGQKPNVASNIMSLAINQAKAQNLTGSTAVSTIVDFIKQKTAEFISLKQQTQSTLQEQKGKINQSLGSLLSK